MKFQLFFGHRLTLCSTFSRPNPIAILKSCLIRTYKHAHTHTEKKKRPNTPIGDERKVLKTKRQCVAANFAALLWGGGRTLSWLPGRDMSMAAANSPASISILYRKKSKEQRHNPRTATTETSYNVWCLRYLRVKNFPQNVIYHTRGTKQKYTYTSIYSICLRVFIFGIACCVLDLFTQIA